MAKDTLTVVGIVLGVLVVLSLVVIFAPAKISSTVRKYILGQG